MLLRPEEVVAPSGPTSVDQRLQWFDPDEPAVVHLNVDSIYAVGTCIVQADAVLLVLAADQQQKIYRSRDAKPLPRLEGHGVKHEPETIKKFLVTIGQIKFLGASSRAKVYEADSDQHAQGPLDLPHRYAQGLGHIRRLGERQAPLPVQEDVPGHQLLVLTEGHRR